MSVVCFLMGQPTSALTQRAGRSQLWEHLSGISVVERGYTDHLTRILFGVRLVILFFQSLVLNGCANLWYLSTKRGYLFFRLQHGWGSTFNFFPDRRYLAIRAQYFETKPAQFFLFDGENSYMTLAYNHRRLRFDSIFWARPRMFKVGPSSLLSLRGYNVTEPRQMIPRSPRVALRKAAPWLVLNSFEGGSLSWF